MPNFGIGVKQVFKLDDSGAVLRDLSQYILAVKVPRDMASHDITTLGATGNAKQFLPGLIGGTISLEILFDPTVDGYISGVVGQSTSLNFEYYPQGTASGKVKNVGLAQLTKYDTGAPVADVVKCTVDLVISGPVTRSLVP